MIYKYPSIVPVNFIDESFSPLISLGREIAAIDDLFISPNGLITIAETKLWRNPEAHRTVVAQILEYAKVLSTWTYEKLDSAVTTFMNGKHGTTSTIYSLVKKQVRDFDIDEIEFQAKVQEGLTNGKFALLIIGDKIFPEATQLAEIIQSAPHLQFTLGFVELQCFRLGKDSNWPLVVIPNVIAKTKEYTRAVVKVIYEEKKPEIDVDTIHEDITSRSTSKTSFSVFIPSLPSNIQDSFKTYIERWIKAGYTVYWGTVGFSVRLSWKGRVITIFDAYPTFTSVILTEKWARKYEFPEHIYQQYREELMKSPVLGNAVVSGRKYLNYDDISAEDVMLILSSTDTFLHELNKMETRVAQ